MGTSVSMIEEHYGVLLGGAIAGLAAYHAEQEREAEEGTDEASIYGRMSRTDYPAPQMPPVGVEPSPPLAASRCDPPPRPPLPRCR
jgi:hypothetical protein